MGEGEPVKENGQIRKSAKEPRIWMEVNQLTSNDWVVLEHLAKLLGFYEDAVRTLEGDGQLRKRKRGLVGSYGNVWEVMQGFEFLLETLEDYKQIACGIPDPEHFIINVNLGWEKLNNTTVCWTIRRSTAQPWRCTRPFDGGISKPSGKIARTGS